MAGIRDSKTVDGVTYNYLTLDGKVVRQTWGSNVLDIIYDNSGLPYAFKYNNAYYIYVLNQQGDVIRIVSSTGATVAEYRYDAWGNVIYSNGSMAAVNPIRYRGYYYDAETGFYYLQSRYYDPSIGRFINADQFASTGQDFIGNNMFAYCNNNPVSRADSKGEFFNTVCGALVGGVIAAITCSDKENRGDAFLRGFTTGAIAGAALDFSIVTAGTGTAVAIAVAGGALAATADYVWEQTNKNEDITLGGVVTNATIGAALNVLFMGAGRVANRHVGNTLASAGKALWDNTVKSVTSRAGNFMMKKFGATVLENTMSSVIQGSFGKIYSLVADQIGVY